MGLRAGARRSAVSLLLVAAAVALWTLACETPARVAPTAAATHLATNSATAPPSRTNPASVATRTPDITYPDPALTPGDVFPVGLAEICKKGYSKSVRDVSTATKDRVYASYGIDRKSQKPNTYELDHLIPLALGGSNAEANLWPQPINANPGAYQKDSLEATLAALVCAGDVPLAQAQQAIAEDWYAAYQRWVLKK